MKEGMEEVILRDEMCKGLAEAEAHVENGGGATSQGMWVICETRKSKAADPPLETPEGLKLCQHLDFSSEDPRKGASQAPELKHKGLMCL